MKKKYVKNNRIQKKWKKGCETNNHVKKISC